MQIFIDSCNKSFSLDVEPTDTVCVLRRLICAKIGLKPGDQSLMYNCKLLGSAPEGKLFDFDDTQTLESYCIVKDATITLSCRGANKREFVPDEESYSSKQKRRALSNAVAPHKRRVERLTSERDEALAARGRPSPVPPERMTARPARAFYAIVRMNCTSPTRVVRH